MGCCGRVEEEKPWRLNSVTSFRVLNGPVRTPDCVALGLDSRQATRKEGKEKEEKRNTGPGGNCVL